MSEDDSDMKEDNAACTPFKKVRYDASYTPSSEPFYNPKNYHYRDIADCVFILEFPIASMLKRLHGIIQSVLKQVHFLVTFNHTAAAKPRCIVRLRAVEGGGSYLILASIPANVCYMRDRQPTEQQCGFLVSTVDMNIGLSQLVLESQSAKIPLRLARFAIKQHVTLFTLDDLNSRLGVRMDVNTLEDQDDMGGENATNMDAQLNALQYEFEIDVVDVARIHKMLAAGEKLKAENLQLAIFEPKFAKPNDSYDHVLTKWTLEESSRGKLTCMFYHRSDKRAVSANKVRGWRKKGRVSSSIDPDDNKTMQQMGERKLVLQQDYHLKYVHMFIKAVGEGNTVQFYLDKKRDDGSYPPLIVRYVLAQAQNDTPETYIEFIMCAKNAADIASDGTASQEQRDQGDHNDDFLFFEAMTATKK